MATEKDKALIRFLFEGTQAGNIHWEATAVEDQFTTSFKGKYSVLVDRNISRDGEESYWVTLKDTEGRELLTIYAAEVFPDYSLRQMYNLAQRESMSVDKAIDEILGSDSDMPF